MKCMHTITDNQAQHQLNTFTIISMSKSWSHHNELSISDVLQGLLKPCCLLGPYNTSDYPITIVVIPLIYIFVPLLPPYCY